MVPSHPNHFQLWHVIPTYIDHDETSRLKNVATDRVKENLCLETNVNLHCWRKLSVLLNKFAWLNVPKLNSKLLVLERRNTRMSHFYMEKRPIFPLLRYIESVSWPSPVELRRAANLAVSPKSRYRGILIPTHCQICHEKLEGHIDHKKTNIVWLKILSSCTTQLCRHF